MFFYKTFHILLYSCSFIKRCGMHIAHAVLEVNASLHFLFLTKTCLFLVFFFLQWLLHRHCIVFSLVCQTWTEVVSIMIHYDRQWEMSMSYPDASLFSHSHPHSKKLREHRACKWGWMMWTTSSSWTRPHIHIVHRDTWFPWCFLQLKTGWYCIHIYSPNKN